MSNVVFWLFFALCGLSALGVAYTKNLLYAALALMLTFFALAAIYVFLSAEFIAVSQIVVYVGGVLVLLLFSILLTTRVEGGKVEVPSLGVFPALLVSGTVFYILYRWVFVDFPETQAPLIGEQSIRPIGINLMTINLVPLEIVAILLLITLVGAASIIKTDKR